MRFKPIWFGTQSIRRWRTVSKVLSKLRRHLKTEKWSKPRHTIYTALVEGTLVSGRIRQTTIQLLCSHSPSSLDLTSQHLQSEVVRSQNSHPKWGLLCATLGKNRTNLPAFHSGHTLTSMGPGTHRPEGEHSVGAHKMERQSWRHCCQHSYTESLSRELGYLKMRTLCSEGRSEWFVQSHMVKRCQRQEVRTGLASWELDALSVTRNPKVIQLINWERQRWRAKEEEEKEKEDGGRKTGKEGNK